VNLSELDDASSPNFTQNHEQSELGEQNELAETQQNHEQSELVKLSELAHVHPCSPSSAKMCKCSCGALFRDTDKGNLGLIKDFHEKQGHTVGVIQN
jgi:hypothetical protein